MDLASLESGNLTAHDIITKEAWEEGHFFVLKDLKIRQKKREILLWKIHRRDLAKKYKLKLDKWVGVTSECIYLCMLSFNIVVSSYHNLMQFVCRQGSCKNERR